MSTGKLAKLRMLRVLREGIVFTGSSTTGIELSSDLTVSATNPEHVGRMGKQEEDATVASEILRFGSVTESTREIIDKRLLALYQLHTEQIDPRPRIRRQDGCVAELGGAHRLRQHWRQALNRRLEERIHMRQKRARTLIMKGSTVT